MEDIYDLIFNLPPKTLTLVTVLLGFVLIDDLSADKQNSLGGFFSLIGSVISANASYQNYIDDIKKEEEYEKLKKDVKDIMKKLEKNTNA